MSPNMAASWCREKRFQASARNKGSSDGCQEMLPHSSAEAGVKRRGYHARAQALHPDVPVFDCNPSALRPRVHSAHTPWGPRQSGTQSCPQYPQLPNRQPRCYPPSIVGSNSAGSHVSLAVRPIPAHIPFAMRPYPAIPFIPMAFTYMPGMFCPFQVESLHRQHTAPRPSGRQNVRPRCTPPYRTGLGQRWSSGPGRQGTHGRDGGIPRVDRKSRTRYSRQSLPGCHLHRGARGSDGGLRVILPQPSPRPADTQSDSDECDSQEEMRLLASASEEVGPELCNSWEWMVDVIMHNIICRLDANPVKMMRLVCKRWRHVVDRNLERLRPSKAKTHTVVALFPNLRIVDLSGCQNVRNRNLAVLAKSCLRLEELVIGQELNSFYGKPRITNSAMASIGNMKRLQRLAVFDCTAITNNGMQRLSALTGLTSLAIAKCSRVSDYGFSVVEKLERLKCLNVDHCCKVTDGIVKTLEKVKGLRSLRLGNTRVTDQGIRDLTKHLRELEEIRLDGEDGLSDVALEALGQVSTLTTVSLASCGDAMTTEGLLQLVRSLPLLRSLDVCHNSRVNDDFMGGLLQAGRLEHFEVHHTAFGERGVLALAHLRSLRSLCLVIPKGTLPNQQHHHRTALIMSELTQLTSLEVESRPIQASLVTVIAKLDKLVRLKLSAGPAADKCQGTRSPGLHVLAGCTSLEQLILKDALIREEEIDVLVKQLPHLADLHMIDCISADNLSEWANRVMPRVTIHRLSSRVGGSSTPSSIAGTT